MSEAMRLDEVRGPIESPAYWYGRDLQAEDGWIETLSSAETDEVQRAVEQVHSRDVSMLEMRREDFPLPILGKRLHGLARKLDHGRGFWLLRGLPVEALGERSAAFAYWGIGLHLGQPVSQNARGHLLGHVTDEGVEFRKHGGARGYQTRLQLPYHTDSSDVVGLLCLQPAKSGGLSSVASTTTTYNEVLKRRPDLAHLWFEKWHYDQRDEQQPGDAPFYKTRLAVLDDDYLAVRYVRPFLDSAERHDGVPPHTPQQIEFLDLVDEIANEPGIALQMDFRPGDIQMVCNYTTFHSRTAYEDDDDPIRKRHLLRLWLTLHGGRDIPEDFGRGKSKAGERGGIAGVPGTVEPLAGTYA
jgi:hypothetical protein